MSRLAYLSVVHAGEALAAAWEAYPAEVPMSWLGTSSNHFKDIK